MDNIQPIINICKDYDLLMGFLKRKVKSFSLFRCACVEVFVELLSAYGAQGFLQGFERGLLEAFHAAESL